MKGASDILVISNFLAFLPVAQLDNVKSELFIVKSAG